MSFKYFLNNIIYFSTPFWSQSMRIVVMDFNISFDMDAFEFDVEKIFEDEVTEVQFEDIDQEIHEILHQEVIDVLELQFESKQEVEEYDLEVFGIEIKPEEYEVQEMIDEESKDTYTKIESKNSESREEKIQRYLSKRKRRCWGDDQVTFQSRKNVANKRPRYKGRFVSMNK